MKPLLRRGTRWVTSENRGVTRYSVEGAPVDADSHLYEIEYLIAETLDGTRDFSEIIEHVEQHHRFTLSLLDLKALLVRLHQLSVLDEGDGNFDPSEWTPAAAPSGLGKAGRLFGGVLLFGALLGGGWLLFGDDPSEVTVAVVDRVAAPVLSPKETWRVEYAGQKSIGFRQRGVLKAGGPTPGTRVLKGELLGYLALSDFLQSRLTRFQSRVSAAEEKRRLAGETLAGIEVLRKKLQARRAALKEEAKRAVENDDSSGLADVAMERRAVVGRLRRAGELKGKTQSSKREAAGELRRAKARLKRFIRGHGGSFAVAPFEGVVLEAPTKIGEVVRLGEPLWTVVKSHQLIFKTSLEMGGAYRDGDTLLVTLADGKLVRVPVVGVSRSERGVVLRVQGSSSLWWGERGPEAVRVVREIREDALAIPEVALFERDGEDASVWKVVGEQVLKVRVRILSSGKTEVRVDSLDGHLSENDSVVDAVERGPELAGLRGGSRVVKRPVL